ncbi:MAG: GAF domain-containing protein, partial [Deltaproteobacteria bacterium]
MSSDENSTDKLKRLGSYLALDDEHLQQILEEQQNLSSSENIRLGDLLLKNKLISPDELHKSIKQQRLDRLASCPLFSGALPSELSNILHLVVEQTVGSGAELMLQDTIGDSFFILANGAAEVCRTGDYGESISLATLCPGESVGEMGYFSDGRRTATVIASTRCDLIRINYADLEHIFRAVPTLSTNFLGLIASRLKKTNIRFQEVAERGQIAERTLDSLRRFLDLSELTALSSGIEALIQTVVFTASKVMEAERASLFLLDETAGELWSKVAEGEGHREIRVPLSNGVVGWAARHGEVVNISEAYEDDRFDQAVDQRTGFRTRNILCGPVKNLQGEVVGVIQVINKKVGQFGPREEALFKAFSYQTAVALDNFHLYRHLLSSHQTLSILFDVANALSQTLD